MCVCFFCCPVRCCVLHPDSSEKANFGDLVTIPDVDAQWEALGAVLRLDRGSLAQIKAKHGGNPLKCKRDMYRLVVKRGVTWRDVIKALCDVGLPASARGVCETYDIFPNGLSSYISRSEVCYCVFIIVLYRK